MRCRARIAALLLCCVLQQLASAHPAATASVQHLRQHQKVHRRLHGTPPRTADVIRMHDTQHKRTSSSPHLPSHGSLTPAGLSKARRLAAFSDAAPLINASTVITKRSCGVPDDSDAVRQQIQQKLSPTIGAIMLEGRVATVYINVYFSINHVGALGDVVTGDVTQAQINAQINQLNHCFAPASFVFQLAGVMRYKNTKWWDVDSNGPVLADFRAAAHKGTFADLNLFTTMLQNQVLGVTTMPWNNDPADGVALAPWTLPGGSYAGYNLGNTACHEVGHWLGLLHTFTGGCSEPNDGISDTAEEARPQFGCPSQAPDSCPNKPSNQPKLDPIHSYMDYSTDVCMTTFTAGQQLRMQAVWTGYRSSAQQEEVAHLPSNTKSASGSSKPKTSAKPHPRPHPKPHSRPHPKPKHNSKPHRKPTRRQTPRHG